MLYLFEEKGHSCRDEISLLEKLNYCSCFASAATVDDQLPQYICLSCSILVANAYQLKVLCGKTQEQFQAFYKEIGKHNDQVEIEMVLDDADETFRIEESKQDKSENEEM